MAWKNPQLEKNISYLNIISLNLSSFQHSVHSWENNFTINFWYPSIFSNCGCKHFNIKYNYVSTISEKENLLEHFPHQGHIIYGQQK